MPQEHWDEDVEDTTDATREPEPRQASTEAPTIADETAVEFVPGDLAAVSLRRRRTRTRTRFR